MNLYLYTWWITWSPWDPLSLYPIWTLTAFYMTKILMMKWVKDPLILLLLFCVAMSWDGTRKMSVNVIDPLGRPVQRMMDRGEQSNSSLAFVKPEHWNCHSEKSTGFLLSSRRGQASVGSLVTNWKSAHRDRNESFSNHILESALCPIPVACFHDNPSSIHLQVLAAKWKKSPDSEIPLTRSSPRRWETI